MKTSRKKTRAARPVPVAHVAVVAPPVTDERLSDDELEIRYSLTALGELAVAHESSGRGRRFRGFGPCGAVA